MKTNLSYILFISGVIILGVLLYPFIIILCIFKPSQIRGLFMKIIGIFYLIQWLESITKDDKNGI
jgi:hypothetical protein